MLSVRCRAMADRAFGSHGLSMVHASAGERLGFVDQELI